MKHGFGFLIAAVLSIMLVSCQSNPLKTTEAYNADSVKTIIMNIQQQMFTASAIPDEETRAKTFESFCEDSLIASSSENNFYTHSSMISHDLYTKYLVPPHDFTFRLFGGTAILSFLETALVIFNADTNFHNVRVTKTFSFDHGTWKMSSLSSTLQPINYFRPIPEKHKNYYPDYAGVYQWSPSILDTIFLKDGKLYHEPNADPESLIYPVDDSTYMSKNELVRYVFGRDKNGKVTHYTFVRYDGQTIRIPKIR